MYCTFLYTYETAMKYMGRYFMGTKLIEGEVPLLQYQHCARSWLLKEPNKIKVMILEKGLK